MKFITSFLLLLLIDNSFPSLFVFRFIRNRLNVKALFELVESSGFKQLRAILLDYSFRSECFFKYLLSWFYLVELLG